MNSENQSNFYDNSPVPLRGYIALILTIIFFSGWLSHSQAWFGIFDINTLCGNYGTINNCTFVGKAGTGARQGFLFAFSLIPGVMFALGVVTLAEKLDALRAAQKILTPIMKPLLGLPGVAGLALISSLQSSDAGSAMTHELYEKKLINNQELTIFGIFQFSAGGSIIVFLTIGIVLFPMLSVPFIKPLGIILLCKVIGANIMRMYLAIKNNINKNKSDNVETSIYTNPLKYEIKTIPLSQIDIYSTIIEGMRKGWDLGIKYILPNIVFAFVLIKILQHTGILSLLSVWFGPVMNIFGLPGEALAVLLTTILSAGGGVGTAAGLYTQGILTSEHLSIITPAIFLMGALVQYLGRILSVAGVPSRYYPIACIIGIINASLGMLFMRWLI